MRLSIVFCLLILGAVSCSKKVAPVAVQTEQKEELKKEVVKKETSNALNDLKRSGVDNARSVRKTIGNRKSEFQSLEELNSALKIKGSVVLSHFKPGSDVPVLTINEEVCRGLVNQINQQDRNTYELVGHTNSKGNAQSNKLLSNNRANKTLDLLASDYSLDLSKMSATGEGESNPIGDNATSKGRRKNSRVELRIR